MKVVAINGSPRAEGNTFSLLSKVTQTLAAEGVSTQIIQVGKKKIQGCTACYKCFENTDRMCSVKNDIFNEVAAEIFAADGIVIG